MIEINRVIVMLEGGKKMNKVTVNCDDNNIYKVCATIDLIKSGQTSGERIRKITVNCDDNEYIELLSAIDKIRLGLNRDSHENVDKLEQEIDRMKAENEKLKKANRVNSEICVNCINLITRLTNENNELNKKNAELEEKHWDECRQITQYDDDLKRLFNEMLEFFKMTSDSATRMANMVRIHDNPYKQPTPSSEPVNCRCSIKPVGNEPAENKTTNLKKIRAMSAEELAKFINNVASVCNEYSECYKNDIKKWLESEVNENDT